MSSFAEMSKVKVDDLPEVKKMPMGHYIWSVLEQPEQKPSASGASTLILFKAKCMGAVDPFDGDEDELAEFGTPSGVRTLMFTYPEQKGQDEDDEGLANRQAAAIKRLRNFLVKDLQIEDEGNLGAMLAASRGCRFIGQIKHEPDNRNPEELREVFGTTAPLE